MTCPVDFSPVKVLKPYRKPEALNQTAVMFSGEGKQDNEKSGWKKGLFLPLALFATLTPAIVTTSPTTVKAFNAVRSGDIDENQYPSIDVNRKGEYNLPPQINAETKQTVFDLRNAPVLMESDRSAIEDLAYEMYVKGYPHLKVLVLPEVNIENPDRFNLEDFMVSVFNDHLKLGAIDKNNGGLLMVDASKLRENRSNKLSFLPGDGIKKMMSGDKFVKLMLSRVIPIVNTAKAESDNGNVLKANELNSIAVRIAMEVVASELQRCTDYENVVAAKRKAEDEKRKVPLTESERAERKREDQALAEQKSNVMLKLVMLMAFLSSAGLGGYIVVKRRNEKKRVAEIVETFQKPLNSMKSSYKVTADNYLKPETLKALLDSSYTDEVKPTELINAINIFVKNKLAETENLIKKEDFKLGKKDPQAYQERLNRQMSSIAEILVEMGLAHSFPEIRRRSVEFMVADGLNRDQDFEPFMKLLEHEPDSNVIESLVKPLLQLSTAEDVPVFAEKLKSSSPVGVRALSIAVLEKFSRELEKKDPKDSTLKRFFAQLEEEKDANLIEKLQHGIKKLAESSKSSMLLENMAESKSLNIRSAAIMGLATVGKSGDKAHFESLYRAFLKDDNKTLTNLFAEALSSHVTEANMPSLFDGLKQPSVKIQRMAIDFLDTLRSSKAVKPLFDYLATVDTKLPEEATQALVNSVTEKNRPMILEIVDSYDPKTEDKEVMTAAIKSLKKLRNPEDLDNLLNALEKDSSPHISEAIQEALAESKHTEQSFEFLNDSLQNSKKSHVRVAAALTLAEYGIQALDPLFIALSRTDSTTPSGEVDVFNKAIAKLSRNEQALGMLGGKAISLNSRVSSIAAQGIISHIDIWEENKTYDDAETMTRLKHFSKHQNSNVAEAAQKAVNSLIEDQVAKIHRLGQSGDFDEYSQDYRYLENLKKNAEYESIKVAARKALNKLARRRLYESIKVAARKILDEMLDDRWEKHERRQNSQANISHRSSSSWSSSSGEGSRSSSSGEGSRSSSSGEGSWGGGRGFSGGSGRSGGGMGSV